jgi:predicted TIM-barrel enzyme
MTRREEVLGLLRAEVAAGRYIMAAGCGTGLSAKCCEAGGCDLIFIYNTARYRMAGASSLAGMLAYGDANAVTLEMAREIVPVLKHAPVIAGINGTDPFRHWPHYLNELRDHGVAGVMNWPSVGLIDGVFRENLEGSGLSHAREVEVIHMAHEMGMITAPWGYDPETTRQMAEAGADIIITHMGLTVSGSVGAAKARTLDQAVADVQAIADAARAVNPDILVFAHGGPISTAADTEYVLHRTTGVHGFLGGSAMERLPNEVAQTAAVREFKAIAPKQGK